MHNDENDPFSDTGPWTEKGVVGSPEEQSEQHFAAVDTEVNVQLHAPKAVPTLDLSDVKTMLGASENEVLVPPPSPSRRRWNTLRSHVLPSLTESETPSLPPEPTEIQRPGTPTSRPQTPRMYRFGQKKSMRHVVDQAREVAVDETRRLTDNIRRACWAVRYGEVSVRQKAEREALSTDREYFLLKQVEQQTAVETFEYAVRTWKAPSSEEELERCLWCCQAASVPSRSRIRILGALSALLFSREKTFRTDTPIILQTLLQAMFSLLSSLASSNASSEAESLKAYIFAIKDGQCGTPTPPALEKEYGVRFSGADRNEKVRDIITTESVIGCLEVGSEACRRWSLRHLLEEYWTLPEPAMKQTPLLSCMNWRKLKTFISSAIALLSSSLADAQTLIMDCDAIVGVLRSRVLPEVEAMQNDDFAAEIQNRVVRLTLELLCIRGSSEREYVMRQFCRWFRDDMRWKLSIEKTIQEFIAEIEWPVIFRLLPTVVEELPEEIRMLMVSSILPRLNDRLMADPPEYPCTPLSVFLETVSRMCPKAFFKPIFTCAVSSKDLTIANQLCVFRIIAKYMPDFWTFDAEMMSVALMSETSNTKSRGKGAAPTWGKVRLGQLVLLFELIEHLRTVRDSKDLSALSAAAKFFTALEARLGLMLETKEQSTLIPVSQRFLFCSLFREIRLLTRSLKPASWLPSVVSWALYDPTQDADQAFNIDDDDEETMATFDKLQALYAQAQAGASGSGKRRTTVILPSNPDIQATKKAQNDDSTPDVLADRLEKLKSLHHALRSTILELLVTISGLLTPEDYLRLTSTLWHRHLDDTSINVVAPTCFLVMQCAEKNADDFVRIIEDDLSSTDSGVRCEAIQKVSTILSWRFQILSQEVILDRTYRRPFKLSRPPILFVPTDIGTNLFILEEDPDDFKDSNGLALPLELRRRLSEIGWTEERGEIDPRTEKIKTPMTLLPTQQLDAFSIGADTPPPQDESRSASPSPEPSPTKSSAGDMSVIRRDSSSTGRSPGARRRPVFVSTLVALFPRLASMMNDDDFLVSSIAKNLVVDLMRDDPALLSRTVFHQLSGDPSSVLSAISTLRTFLHVQHTLPPGMAHHVLNHLAGFLKSSVRHTELTHPLQSYAYCVPVIAKLVVQVGKLSIREIRRAKVDMFLIPSGSLWFPPSAPTGPMFPRALGTDNNPFEPLPSTLVWITLIRTSQNMLFLSMLKRNPQDIKAIRKHMTRLVLPSRGDNSDQSPIPLVTFAPRKRHEGALSNDLDVMALSLTLARSYLLLLNQAFRSMSRHLNDRNELAIHLDGLNRILLAHGDDIGIVAQTMLALLVASTRFRRLFTSGGGYTLFMPAVIKTYCEAESHPGIRAAIEFAINRFYALHQESFVFQTFDIMSHIITLPDVDSGWIAKNVYTLFATLKNSSPANDYDAAGICNLTKAEEQEALMVRIAEEVPQAFFASIRLGGQGQNQVTMEVPEQHEGKHLGLDDLVRLFLTVIAHNPGIQRAQHFLRFLLLLAPYLYHASGPARSVLRDGVDALGVILVNRGAGKAKVPESAQIRPPEDYSYLPDASSQGNSSQVYSSSSSSSTSDLLAMRLDYLSLVLALRGQEGGWEEMVPHAS
ncbi:hypothetical protein A0H81_12594 [Grifola frondosa]|uniref:Protein UNC80 C-terminal domain-containing protein n=1 Tax=Grifola frondosa TaxID=5627 RepID=A0A1C7LXK5_GRIFR|nr:hypothetical protein A0H81_12594 [Grifola frondosa]